MTACIPRKDSDTQSSLCGKVAPRLLRYTHICTAHGDRAVSRITVYRWVDQFEQGRKSVSDLPRLGRPRARDSDSLSERVLDLIEVDCRLTIREIADRLNCPRSTVHRCMTDMGLVKLSARWVPRLLSADMKLQRLQTCRSSLDMVQQYGGWNVFRHLIVTGDETWIPYFEPTSKKDSMVWTVKGSDPPVKARRDAHCKKVMLTFFFDCNGPLTIEFLEPNTTINANGYVATLSRLKGDIQNKRRGVEKPHILHHDNARPHTARQTTDAISQLNFEHLPHPPYSPDLAPADFALFPQMKQLLRG